MNIKLLLVSAAAASALFASAGYAQTPDPATSPSSASSPAQRDATHSNATEAPATPGAEPSDAATPHQRDTMKPSSGMMSPKAKMKDCMAQQSAKNEGMSKSDMTKACNDQMKMEKDHSNMSTPK